VDGPESPGINEGKRLHEFVFDIVCFENHILGSADVRHLDQPEGAAIAYGVLYPVKRLKYMSGNGEFEQGRGRPGEGEANNTHNTIYDMLAVEVHWFIDLSHK